MARRWGDVLAGGEGITFAIQAPGGETVRARDVGSTPVLEDANFGDACGQGSRPKHAENASKAALAQCEQRYSAGTTRLASTHQLIPDIRSGPDSEASVNGLRLPVGTHTSPCWFRRTGTRDINPPTILTDSPSAHEMSDRVDTSNSLHGGKAQLERRMLYRRQREWLGLRLLQSTIVMLRQFLQVNTGIQKDE